MTSKELIVIMGISGAGKTELGKTLSKELGLPFIDADDFHPQENIKKMVQGISLTDEDRWPWLASIIEFVLSAHRNSFILACSALKQSYRDYLNQRLKNQYIFLEISQSVAESRLKNRKDHYMPPALVKSQLETLEFPENAIVVPAETSIPEMLIAIKSELRHLNKFH